jgi:hypothetical protein
MEEWPLPSGASVSDKLLVMQAVTGVTVSADKQRVHNACKIARARERGVQDAATTRRAKEQGGTITGGAFAEN